MRTISNVKHYEFQKLKYAFMGQMEAHLTEMMEDVVDSLEKTESSSSSSLLISKSILSKDKRFEIEILNEIFFFLFIFDFDWLEQQNGGFLSAEKLR